MFCLGHAEFEMPMDCRSGRICRRDLDRRYNLGVCGITNVADLGHGSEQTNQNRKNVYCKKECLLRTKS